MLKLKKDEKIIKTFRRHWFPLFVAVLSSLFLFILPILGVVFLGRLLPINEIANITLTSPVVIFLLSTWSLLLWLFFFSAWTDHYLDGWIITNKRVMDINQRGFFSRETSSFRLERIQDVTVDVHGIIATLLKFGDVHAQTAGDGSSRDFILKTAAKPYDVRQNVLEQHDKIIEKRNFSFNDTTGGV